MKRSKLLVVLGMLFLLLTSESCNNNEADEKQRIQTEKHLLEAYNKIGFPKIKNFTELKLANHIAELRDKEKLICYAYIVNMNGDLIFLGKCIGYGLPYSVQTTNPEKIAYSSSGYRIKLPQAEPNGLFMPEGLSATWINLIDEKTGETHPVYVEPQIIVSPVKLHLSKVN